MKGVGKGISVAGIWAATAVICVFGPDPGVGRDIAFLSFVATIAVAMFF